MKTGTIIILVIAVAVVFGLFLKSDKASQESVVVTNFLECVEVGNPVMESYPRQCSHGGVNYVEVIEDLGAEDGNSVPFNETAITQCDQNNRPEACTKEYEPVCGLVQVECITTPCNPVPEAFSNGCTACSNERVISYTEGQCS